MNVNEYRMIAQKNEEENYFFDKYVLRKISIYFTILFIKLNIKANQATFLSLLAALGSLYFLAQNSPVMMLIAAILIFSYNMLDHVDGELARYYISKGTQKPSLAGQYFDVLIHKYSTNLMLFFLGVSVYNQYEYHFAVLLGFAACIGMSAFPNLMASQVIVQKIVNEKDIVYNEDVGRILDLLEKKKEQIKKIRSQSAVRKLRKILTELLFFPGALIMIILVLLVDIFSPDLILFSYAVNFRLLYLLFVTPLYLVNAIRQSSKWMKHFNKI
jgi:phosphatidylglycerophosphate synthase